MPRKFLSLCLAACFFFSAFALAEERPNVVILLADDLGYRDIGVYDGPVKTPHLDALAARGTRFQQFYSGCAVCSPSRAVLLTGRHHIRTGVYSWIFDATQKSHLRTGETTLAEILKGAGYDTAHVGKWHLGVPTEKRDKPTPEDHGFDHWFATANNAGPSHRNPKNFVRNGEAVGEIEGYSCQIVVDEAVSWLGTRNDSEAPFFLNVWFHEPHAPIAAPEEIVSQYEKGGDSAKKGKKSSRSAVYSGTIDNTDRAIGRLFDHLVKSGQMENTLIIYASDNGSYLADRCGDLRGTKGTNWDGGIRVPGIFAWPSKIMPGVVSQEAAGLVDVLPTVCDLLGLDKPEGAHLDGSSLAAHLLGDSKKVKRHQPLFWHLQKARPIVAMRDGRYSLVADPDYELSKDNMFNEAWIPAIKTGGYTNYQLFDLEKDPNQTTNLAEEKPELLNRMKKQLLEINASIMADGADWHED
ncbi:MAG: sulfatase-like hydrolase/transferase [Verrucomicrobiales bacterium]|nr:sulfatase-like hydrolase/transferase [Verrucomicrobiales bacterium]